MKKRFLIAAVAVLSLGLCLESCKKSDPDPEPKALTATFTVDPKTSSDLMGIYDFSFDYNIKDAKNASQKNTVVLTAARKFENITCPCTIEVNYRFNRKSGATIDATKEYRLEWGPSYTIVSSEGAILSLSSSSTRMDVVGANVTALFDELNKTDNKITYTIDKDGKVSKTE